MDPRVPPDVPTEPDPMEDWDRMYREGLPPWEIGKPHDELIRVLREHRRLIPGPIAIELGSGTGADAVCLAKARLDVTAVEISPIAMERARARAELAGAAVHFVLEDVFRYAETAGKFDLIYDAGFYHFARQKDLSRLLDVLWRLSRPGTVYLTLAGNAEETAEGGPPGVTERDIHLELGRLFEMVELRRCRLASPVRAEGYLAWSCLMRRPQPVGR